MIEVFSTLGQHDVDELIELQPPLHTRHYDIDMLKQKHDHTPVLEVEFALIRNIALFELLSNDEEIVHESLHCFEFEISAGWRELMLKEVGKESEEIVWSVACSLLGLQLNGYELQDKLID